MTDELKPVAWMYELAGARFTNLDGSKSYTNWKSHITTVYPNVPVDGLRNLTPLYTADQLEAARTQGWNEAIEAAATIAPSKTSAAECETVGQWTRRTMREAIRALTKENSDG